MTVAKAARARADLVDSVNLAQKQLKVLDVFIPVVVVDGHLFEAYLDESDGLQVQEITR